MGLREEDEVAGIRRLQRRWGEINTQRRKTLASQLRGPESASPHRHHSHYIAALREVIGRDAALIAMAEADPGLVRDMALIAYASRARAPKVRNPASAHIHIRVTPDVKADIATAAALRGEQVSEYLLRLHSESVKRS